MRPGASREVSISADGLTLRGLQWGEIGPPVLLVHATSFCAEVWEPAWRAAQATQPAPSRALASDQRGHGRSDAPAGRPDFGWDLLAQDVGAWIAHLSDPHPVWLVGHSSGGAACLAAAGLEPSRVAGVALVEPVLFVPPASKNEDSFAGSRLLAERAIKRRHRFASREDARETLRGRFPYSGFDPEVLEAYLDGGFEEAADGALDLRCRPESEAWAYEGAAALDLWALAPRVHAPLLVVQAEHSAVPGELLARLGEMAPQLQLEKVEGTTHFAALERPDAVGAVLGRFLHRAAGG